MVKSADDTKLFLLIQTGISGKLFTVFGRVEELGNVVANTPNLK